MIWPRSFDYTKTQCTVQTFLKFRFRRFVIHFMYTVGDSHAGQILLLLDIIYFFLYFLLFITQMGDPELMPVTVRQ